MKPQAQSNSLVNPPKKRGRPKGSVSKAKKAEPVQSATVEHPLMPVFRSAIEQVTRGKGVRHGGESVPFAEQPWAHYAHMHGRGFLTGQAAKKLEEAATTKEGEAFVQEMLGAMVYIGMAILHAKGKRK